MTSQQPKAKTFESVAGLAGAFGGYFIANYCGVALLIPGVAFIILLLIFTQTPLKPRWFTFAIAVTAAHLLWFIIGVLITGAWHSVLIDAAFFALCLVWLWVRPGIAPMLVLGIFQVLVLAANVYQWSHLDWGTLEHRAIAVHGLLRIACICGLIIGCIQMRNASLAAPAIEPATPPLT